jgi:hypothetical protein
MVDLLLKDPEMLVFREFNCLYLVYGAVMLLKYGIKGCCNMWLGIRNMTRQHGWGGFIHRTLVFLVSFSTYLIV